MIKASDTYVLVIAISVLPILHYLGVEKLGCIWSRTKRWIPIHKSFNWPRKVIMPSICFTGCDVASAFHGKGGNNACQTWNIWPEASTDFRKLRQYPLVLGENDQSILEKFLVTMYDRSSATNSIDEIRLELCPKTEVV